MTLDEVKQIPMKEIAEQYGFRPSRAGFIHCPFHEGDRGASMKIYAKDFHCFACGAHGTQVDFVMKMDGVSFKEAFMLLGGTYEKATPEMKEAIRKAHKAKEDRERKERKIMAARRKNNDDITRCRSIIDSSEPLSDEWCEAQNALQIALYHHERLNAPPKIGGGGHGAIGPT